MDDLTSRVQRVLVLSLRVWATRDIWLSAEREWAKTAKEGFQTEKHTWSYIPPTWSNSIPGHHSGLRARQVFPPPSWLQGVAMLQLTQHWVSPDSDTEAPTWRDTMRDGMFFFSPQLGRVQQSKNKKETNKKKASEETRWTTTGVLALPLPANTRRLIVYVLS